MRITCFQAILPSIVRRYAHQPQKRLCPPNQGRAVPEPLQGRGWPRLHGAGKQYVFTNPNTIRFGINTDCRRLRNDRQCRYYAGSPAICVTRYDKVISLIRELDRSKLKRLIGALQDRSIVEIPLVRNWT